MINKEKFSSLEYNLLDVRLTNIKNIDFQELIRKEYSFPLRFNLENDLKQSLNTQLVRQLTGNVKLDLDVHPQFSTMHLCNFLKKVPTKNHLTTCYKKIINQF